MWRPALVFFLGFLFCISAGPARADKRVALIIGISKYQQVPRLPNPVRDAQAVAALFKRSGFDIVDSELDLGIVDLRRAIREFSDKSRDADISVVYYAGHGIEVDGTNYLVAADARLSNDFDVEDETVSLDRVLRALDSVKRLRLVILDACRDNPFAKTMKRTVASRSIGRGLARIEPASSNTLVVFSAKAGAVADDGDGQNSNFATALLKHIAEPGLDLRLAFGRVRDEVLQTTGNRQEPFVYGSLGGDTLALVPAAAAAPVDSEAEARIDYELAAQLGTKEVWDSFLATHPNGLYANLARAQNEKLVAAQQSHAQADDARRDAEEKAAQKAEELRKQQEDQALRKNAEAKQRLSEQTRKELEEAQKQLELAQRQAEAARQQVEEAKRQAVAEAQLQVDQAKRAARQEAEKLAALTPNQPAGAPSPPSMNQSDITRLLQAHLKRVGCNSGKIDGNWNEGSQKALELFNKNAKTEFDIQVASIDALDAVRDRPDRVCPLICARGQRAEGERCIQIGCSSGYFLNSSGSCEKHREPAPRARTAIRAPAAPQLRSRPSGGCGLDASGHREGGWLCRD
jgi:uncharacterized caspase-like protein